MTDDQLIDLLTETERALGAILPSADGASPRAAGRFPLEEFQDAAAPVAAGDDRLDLRIELGRTRLRLDEARKLRGGSVIPLDKSIGEPVAVYAGRRRVARGELLVLEGKIAVRLVEVTGL